MLADVCSLKSFHDLEHTMPMVSKSKQIKRVKFSNIA
jgi:hypothetical protein